MNAFASTLLLVLATGCLAQNPAIPPTPSPAQISQQTIQNAQIANQATQQASNATQIATRGYRVFRTYAWFLSKTRLVLRTSDGRNKATRSEMGLLHD
jgi:hypothetical protein